MSGFSPAPLRGQCRVSSFLFRACFVWVATLCVLAPVRAADEPITPEEQARGFRTRTFLAKPRAGLAEVANAEAAANVRLVRAHPRLGGLRTLETDGSEDVKDVIQRLSATGLYDYIEPDYVRRLHAVPNDARFALDQWSLDNTGQSGGTAGADIKAKAAWDIQRDAPDVIVAVMDTGVALTHEDIAGNLWTNPTETGKTTGVDDDGNGYIDDENGINATVAKTSPRANDPFDEDGHGTHVAGIIGAAGDNGKGIAGVAWKVKIMPLKFIGQRGGSISAAIACIDYAIAKGAHIINGSYGSTAYSQAEFEAMKRARDAGILFVASAGNDSQEITALPEYPAAYALDNIVAVASTTRQDKLASYSTYGSGLVELAAPGSSILSLGIDGNDSYATKSGTSMAAPHVAGALALLKQKFPGENYRALINRLLGAVDILPALDNRVHTNGRLNLQRALSSTHTRPFNDDFARRALIVGESNTARSSNQFATRETGEPDHGVPDSLGSLWWSWTAPEDSGTVTLSTAGSGIDTVLAVYRVPASGTATLASLERVAANDDVPGGTSSSVSFTSVPGTSYAIAVSTKGGDGLISFTLVSVPVHDTFARAKPLTGPSVVVDGNTAAATSETGEPKPRTPRGTPIGIGHSLWYKWVAPANRPYQVSAYQTGTDPLVAIYTGSTVSALVEVASDDDSGPFFDSLVRFNATAGVTYYIRVDTSEGPGGRFRLSIADAAWQYTTDSVLYTSSAVAPDGTLYLADGLGYVHAITPGGTRKWRSAAVFGYSFGGSVCVGADGTLYVADDFGTLYALDPATGAEKWSFETGDLIWTSPAIGSDGTIYVKSDDGYLYAVSPSGTEKWSFPIPGDTYSSPVVAGDGTIYIAAGGDNTLYALNPTGTVKWRAPLGGTCYASPALGADGTIYLGNFDGRFFAFRPDGTVRWQFDTRSALSGSAVVDARGVVYFGSYDKKLYALDGATGAKRWDYTLGDIIRSTTPVLADDGTVYIGGDDGFIHALTPEGTLRRTYATAAPILSSPLIAAGRLYVGSSDGKLYAFDTGNNLARSPWPMQRHNLRALARAVDLPGIPVFTTQPVANAAANAGSPITLTAAASLSAGTPLYQWYFNDEAIPGATSASLHFSSVQGSNTGVYRLLATGPGGSIVSTSTSLQVATTADNTARLVNLAVRTSAGSGDRALFVGFVVGGNGTSGSKPLLLRGIGPALLDFGIGDALRDPKLQLNSGSTLLVENDDWAGDAQIAAITPKVGAFPLLNTASKDSALFTTRTAGSYTALISAASGAPGIALAEIYDGTDSAAFTSTTPRLINVSARTRVGTGGDVLIAGFVVGGSGPKTVLVRAIGPTLRTFNVDDVLADPKLELFQGNNAVPLASSDNWGTATNATQIAAAAGQVGAFGLALESRDAVLLVTLQPGSYTAKVSGVNDTTGVALIEIYEVQ